MAGGGGYNYLKWLNQLKDETKELDWNNKRDKDLNWLKTLKEDWNITMKDNQMIKTTTQVSNPTYAWQLTLTWLC